MFLFAEAVVPLFLKQQKDYMFYNMCAHQNFVKIKPCKNRFCLKCQACQALVTWAPGLQDCAMEIIFVANNHFVK